MPLPMMKCSFSRLEVGRSSSMLLPRTVGSPSCSLLVTWATGTGQGLTRQGEARGLTCLSLLSPCPQGRTWEGPEELAPQSQPPQPHSQTPPRAEQHGSVAGT